MFGGLSEQDKEIVLKALYNYSKLGKSMESSIEIMAKLEKNKKFLKLYERLHYLIDKKLYSTAKALEYEKVISGFESFIIENSVDARGAIVSILELKKIKSKYDWQLFKLFFPSLGVYIATLTAMPLMKDLILWLEEYIIDSYKTKKNMDMSGQIELPFYTDIAYLDVYCNFGTIVVIFMILFYIFNIKTEPYRVYKLFKGKAYSDSVLLFSVINEMSKTGKTLDKILETLRGSKSFKKDMRLLGSLSIADSSGKSLSRVFELYDYPQDLVYFFQMGEQTSTLWEIMPDIIELSKNQISASLQNLKMYTKILFWSLVVVAAFVFGITLISAMGMQGFLSELS
jgi:hypothetical protein